MTDVERLAEKGYKPRGIIHVGANDGPEIQDYLNAGFGPVLAFEPHPDAYLKLVKRYQGDARVVTWKCALSDRTGSLVLNIPEDGDTEKSSKYVPIPHEGEDHAWTKVPTGGVISVNAFRFDDFIADTGISLIGYNTLVLDVQGMELEVLRGFGSTLINFDLLSVECSADPMYDGEAPADEVIEYLAGKGFRQISDVELHDDVLFVRKTL